MDNIKVFRYENFMVPLKYYGTDRPKSPYHVLVLLLSTFFST